jgi:transcriptional regulator with XRE-family HTH domain
VTHTHTLKRYLITTDHRDNVAIMKRFVPRVISTRRHALGFSLEHVADQVGVSIQAVNQWEHGRTTPTVDKLGPLAAALRCPLIDDLFHDDPPEAVAATPAAPGNEK